MNEEGDKGVKAMAKDVFIGDNIPTSTPVSSQPAQIRPTVAGITVTPGGLRINASPAASLVNSIRVGQGE